MLKEKTINLRMSLDTLNQLDALVELEAGGNRSNYLRALIEERYTMSQFIAADTMAQTLNKVAKEEAAKVGRN